MRDGTHDQLIAGRDRPVARFASENQHSGRITHRFADPRVGEELPNKFLTVAPMVGEGLAGPFPRRQHPASGQSEGAAAVCLALAPARYRFVVGAFRDDAVAQPDRAPLRTRRDRQFGVQPFMMLPLRGGVGFDDFADRFRQVLGEVADVASGFLGAAQDALGLALLPEPHHVSRLRVLVDCEGIQRLIPRRERCVGVSGR